MRVSVSGGARVRVRRVDDTSGSRTKRSQKVDRETGLHGGEPCLSVRPETDQGAYGVVAHAARPLEPMSSPGSAVVRGRDSLQALSKRFTALNSIMANSSPTSSSNQLWGLSNSRNSRLIDELDAGVRATSPALAFHPCHKPHATLLHA